tara:strand:+ start:3080 stop:3556 length:477 start_codon:yes stop_codon:yes gene_type:complete
MKDKKDNVTHINEQETTTHEMESEGLERFGQTFQERYKSITKPKSAAKEDEPFPEKDAELFKNTQNLTGITPAMIEKFEFGDADKFLMDRYKEAKEKMQALHQQPFDINSLSQDELNEFKTIIEKASLPKFELPKGIEKFNNNNPDSPTDTYKGRKPR